MDDLTLQRPLVMYGACKLFGEHLGLFYKRNYGLDFRGVRFPALVGPGVRTRGAVQYTAWMIEESVRGKPFTVWVEPRTRAPVLYFKDAARSLVELARAPAEDIGMVNYLLAGVTPVPSAGELADLTRAQVPGARIAFAPDGNLQALLDKVLLPIDERCAREEWGWAPRYDLEAMVADFRTELERHPGRYA